MSGCANYVENLWKKGKCSNCFRSKDQHSIGTNDGVHQNGETTRSKYRHDGLKSITPQTNGHSTNKGQTSTRASVDGGELLLRKTSNSGKICEPTETDLTKAALPFNPTNRQNGSNGKNSAICKKDSEDLESPDRPKPIPRHKPRSSSKNSSFDEDNLKSTTSEVSSSENNWTANNPLNETVNQINTTNIASPVICSGNSVSSHSKQLKTDRKFSSEDNDFATMEGETKDEPNINTDNTKEKAKALLSLKPSKSGGIDGEYMPMQNNVCKEPENQDESIECKVEAIKITSPSSSQRDDSSKAINNSNDFTEKANKQDSDERHNNNSSIDSIISSNQGNQANDQHDFEALKSEHYYENQPSVESEENNSSSSSEKSLSKFPINITSPSDRPESIAFKLQVEIEELRASSLFEDMVLESSADSTQSSKNDTDSSSENTVESTTHNEPATRRHSNPDVTKLVEGPEYTNSSVKPQPKPYKVVDISGVVVVHDNEVDNCDIPPLPPKEKDRQKETSGPDHYYYEPPDDIVPDYKKLTPLNTEPPPPPVVIRKDSQGTTVPASLKSMPVPRPRSQLPSYSSSTLPRPVPRAAKPDKKEPAIRPVSQVVTRPTSTDAPRPPSTSSIPSRKAVTELSPPTSPTDTHVRSGSIPSLEHKDQTIKPKRTAPPPPLSQLAVPNSGGQPSSKSPTPSNDPRKDSPQTTPSPSTSRPEQTAKSPIMSAKNQGRSTIKRAWKRLSGRRKNKKKLEISSPIMMSEESDSTETGEDSAVCTRFKDRKRASTIEEQPQEHDPPNRTPSSDSNDGEDTIALPGPKPGRPYQNFPFSKSQLEKPAKPDRHAKVKPVLQVRPEVNQNLNNQNYGLESPAYLEPCTGDLTLKVEAALANLNDAKILAETLSRVEQEKLGPLPQVPRSRHVHFRFNETSRPVTAVSPTVVSKPKYLSRPSSTHGDSRIHSKSLTAQSGNESSSRARSSSIQENTMKKRYNKILELHRQTLQDMIDSSKDELLPGDNIDISSTRWKDYEVCGSSLTITSPGAVSIPVIVPQIDEELVLMAKVKIPKSVTEDMAQRTAFMQDMATTVSLPFHANVSRTITHFTDHLPCDLFGVESPANFETLVTITDQVPVETVQEFQERTVQEHLEVPDEYERKVCFLMVQVLSALDHLHQQGLVHRALLLYNLLLLNHGHLIISNFSQVLQKSGGDTPSSQFQYTKESLGSNIGTDPYKIPPEIHRAYDDGQLMDFEKCDAFSAGCLIYELLHQPNPFSTDPSLMSREYTILDLPVLTESSRFTSGLSALASGLLQREPSVRMLPRDALKLLQAFIWGPEDLDDTCLEMSASDWLETERAHAVINIARTQAHSAMINGEEVLENFLKYQYLVNLTEDDVVKGYKALMTTTSQA